jgi:hypothetical protein
MSVASSLQVLANQDQKEEIQDLLKWKDTDSKVEVGMWYEGVSSDPLTVRVILLESMHAPLPAPTPVLLDVPILLMVDVSTDTTTSDPLLLTPPNPHRYIVPYSKTGRAPADIKVPITQAALSQSRRLAWHVQRAMDSMLRLAMLQHSLHVMRRLMTQTSIEQAMQQMLGLTPFSASGRPLPDSSSNVEMKKMLTQAELAASGLPIDLAAVTSG